MLVSSFLGEAYLERKSLMADDVVEILSSDDEALPPPLQKEGLEVS